MREQEKHPVSVPWRRKLAVVVLLILPAPLLWKAYELQVLQADFHQQQGLQRHQRSLPINAYRGRIVDRHGEALAVSTPIDSLWADPSKLLRSEDGVWEAEEVRRLAEAIELSEDTLRQMLEQAAGREFVYLARHVEPERVQRVKAAAVQGINTLREYRRYYPLGEAAAQLVGYTNVDDKGQEGVERMFDSVLRATPGQRTVLQDRFRHTFAEVDVKRAPRHGQDLRLSVDQRIQYLTHRELKLGYAQHRAAGASAVVLDVHSGEVLAMSNLPAYNPNDTAQRRGAALRNRVVTDMLEPGSTIKPMTAVAALEHDPGVRVRSVATAPGQFNIAGYTIKDAANYGDLDLQGILKKSSNVGMSKIALDLPKEELHDTLQRFGFGAQPTLLFPGEVAGRLRPAANWARADHAAVSYGYGISVTLMQLASAYATLANKGEYVEPTLLADQVPRVEQVADAEHVHAVAQMLEAVVGPGGTAQRAHIDGYSVAGKTGTTLKLTAAGYEGGVYQSLFVGFAPAQNPRVVVAVLVDEPRAGEYYGGVVAAPIFAQIMSKTLRLLGIIPEHLEAKT